MAGIRVRSVAAGYQHSLALGYDSRVYSWGDNGFGKLGEFNRDGDLISVPRDPVVGGKVSFECVVIVGFGVVDRVVKDFAR
jgi:alpha-tubulin suppressor-like RCC1 family protein